MRLALLRFTVICFVFKHVPLLAVPLEFTNPHDNYYQTIDPDPHNGSLPEQLSELIRTNHRLISYKEAWNGLRYSDQSLTSSNKVVLFYMGIEIDAKKSGGLVGDWNREHVWAKSKGNFGTRRGPGTDIHQLRPTSVMINSIRGSKSFDEGGRPYEHPHYNVTTGNKVSSDTFEPRDEVKGDVARILFYMAIRYGENSDYELKIVDEVVAEGSKQPRIGKLSTLIKWHREDPVSEFEMRRNNRIHHFQGNRNPFIDHPEWAAMIWYRD